MFVFMSNAITNTIRIKTHKFKKLNIKENNIVMITPKEKKALCIANTSNYP